MVIEQGSHDDQVRIQTPTAITNWHVQPKPKYIPSAGSGTSRNMSFILHDAERSKSQRALSLGKEVPYVLD